MTDSNQFRYLHSDYLQQVTMLQAEIHDFSYDKHAHEELSIGVTRQGLQHFTSGGSRQRSQPGNSILFNPEQVHDGHGESGDCLLYNMLYIHPQQLQPMLYAAGVSDSHHFRIKENVIGNPALSEAVLQLSGLIASGSDDALLQDYWLYQLCARLALHQRVFVANQRQRHIDTRLLKARDFIHDYVCQPLTLEQIAAEIGVSKYHFLRLFRSQFGITPHQYIVSCKVDAARRALTHGETLDDVVFNFGFADLSHFNRRFKPIVGMTPKQYQRSLQRN